MASDVKKGLMMQFFNFLFQSQVIQYLIGSLDMIDMSQESLDKAAYLTSVRISLKYQFTTQTSKKSSFC